jgi:dihydroxyacetone kinase-like predicted kinase
MTSDPNSWPESKATVAPGPIWNFTRGYVVEKAGRHENEKQFRAFTFYLNSGDNRNYVDTAKFAGVGTSTVHKWAHTYNWDRRCAAYDKKEMAIAFKEASKLRRQAHRKDIDDFRKANEEQARLMMGVSSDLMGVIQKKIAKLEEEGEEVPLHLVSGLLRAASNISDSGRQAWATSLGVNELMSVVEQEIEEVQVEIIDEEVDEAYEIPLDEE